MAGIIRRPELVEITGSYNSNILLTEGRALELYIPRVRAIDLSRGIYISVASELYICRVRAI